MVKQPREEQLVLVQLRRSTIFRDVALELETPQEEDGNRSLEEPDSTERFITLFSTCKRGSSFDRFATQVHL